MWKIISPLLDRQKEGPYAVHEALQWNCGSSFKVTIKMNFHNNFRAKAFAINYVVPKLNLVGAKFRDPGKSRNLAPLKINPLYGI